MLHIVEGLKKAWEVGPGALIGSVIGAVIGMCVWARATSMLTAPAEQSVVSILVGGAIVGCALHLIVETVRGKDSWS